MFTSYKSGTVTGSIIYTSLTINNNVVHNLIAEIWEHSDIINNQKHKQSDDHFILNT